MAILLIIQKEDWQDRSNYDNSNVYQQTPPAVPYIHNDSYILISDNNRIQTHVPALFTLQMAV